MSETTYRIIFNESDIDIKKYPEASMSSKDSIVVESDNGYVIPSGKEEIKLYVNGDYKVYRNVLAITPYYYNEG
jgi:hypothetical protein